MFQTSIATVEEYPCLLHKKQKITHVCTDFKCIQNPFLCLVCFNQNIHKSFHTSHEQLLTPINESVMLISNLIEGHKSQMDKMYQSTISKKQNDNLFKKIEMGDRHYQLLNSHIKNLKLQIDKETDSLINQIQKKILVNKQNLFMQLDNYEKNYIQNMENLKNMIDPVISFNKRYKFYSNSNNTSLKLLSELKRKSLDWFLELKKVLNSSCKIIEKPQNYYQNIVRISQFININCQQFPYLKGPDAIQTKKQSLHYVINDTMMDMLSLKQLKTIQITIPQNNQTYRNSNLQREILQRNRFVLKPNKI